MDQSAAFVQALKAAGYVVLGELGRGGMGLVLAAEQVSLGRRVALKVLLEEVGRDGEMRKRLAREAAVLQKLTHPNVVRLLDSIEVQGQLVLVFELVPKGRTLDEVGSARVGDAAGFAEQVLRGLAHVHAAGVLHRDLKPANVLVAEDGTAKLTDFGLARDVSADETRQTRTGAIIGTLSYMAPEQLTGERATPAADVYAWALVAYELFAGRPVFSGPDAIVTPPKRLTTDVPPLRAHARAVDPRVSDFLARCLRRDPARRPEDGGAALKEWEAALAEEKPARTSRRTETLTAGPASSPRGRGPLAVALAAILAAGLAGWAAGRRGAAPPPAAIQVPEPRQVDVSLTASGDEVRVRVAVAPPAAARLTYEHRFGSRALSSASTAVHAFTLPTRPLEDTSHAALWVDGYGAVPLALAAEPLVAGLEQGLRAIDPKEIMLRAARVGSLALPIEKRLQLRDEVFPPALREKYRQALPFAPHVLGGPRTATADALRRRVFDLELLEGWLDRCTIETPIPAGLLWPRGWAPQSTRYVPGTSWNRHHESEFHGAKLVSLTDALGAKRPARVGTIGGRRVVFFIPVGAGAVAGESGQTICSLPLELPEDRDPPPVMIALDCVDLPRSLLWVTVNGGAALPLGARGASQAGPKDNQREHARVIPPALLRRGRNDVQIGVRPFPGFQDKSPAYVNGVLLTWPE